MAELIVNCFIITLIAYLSSNCHVELWATEKEENIKKEADKK